MANRQGIEIDYCQRCRGVWLDRGELDKVIERSAQYVGGYSRDSDDENDDDDDDDRRRRFGGPPQYPPPGGAYGQPGYPPAGVPPQPYGQPPYPPHPYPHKKKSFWSELFD